MTSSLKYAPEIRNPTLPPPVAFVFLPSFPASFAGDDSTRESGKAVRLDKLTSRSAMRLRWHSSTRQSSTCSFHLLIIAEGDHATELGVSQKEGSIGFGMDERMECLRFDPYAATSKVPGGTAQIAAISVVDSQHWLPVKGHRACLECRRYDFRRTGGTILGCLF